MQIAQILTGIFFIAGLIVIASRAGKYLIVRHYCNGRKIRIALGITALILAAICFVAAIINHTNAGWTSLIICLLALLVVVIGLSVAKIKTPEANHKRVVLAVGAHPDDLELACGGTLARLADMGHEIHAITMSRGQVGAVNDDGSKRIGEASRGAKFIGLESFEIYDFPDTQLSLTENQIMQKVEEKIDEIKPDLILTHSKHDQHQDHEAVHRAVMRAARNHHSILCFESPSVTAEFSPGFFVDVSQYVDVKVESVLTHRNQAGKPYMTPDVLKSITGFRGRQAKRKHAEGFEVVRVLLGDSGVFA